MAQENDHYVLKRHLRNSRSSSRTITVLEAGDWEGKRVGLQRGSVEFVLTGLYGLGNPRISVASNLEEDIEVEYSFGSDFRAFGKVVESLGLTANTQEQLVTGWTLQSDAALREEPVNNWPEDLFGEKRSGNGVIWSYLVTSTDSGGAIYRKDGQVYVVEITGAELARMLEYNSRKIVHSLLPKDETITLSFPATDLRGWDYEGFQQLGAQLKLKYGEVTVPMLVVETAHEQQDK